MRVTLFDYGAGNLHSLAKALQTGDIDLHVETDPVAACRTDVLVLPGVGAFAHAAERLAAGREVMRQAIAGGLPTIGICLGMQLLFDASDEGEGQGLGVIPGRVRRLRAVRIPQIGWNTVDDGSADPLLAVAPLHSVYYANGYVCDPVDPATVAAWTTHDGDRFAAMVRTARTVGVQFHPEKSSSDGVRFLRAFLDEARLP
jgi:imidazole glycerol-phosphate synthase subunit HisH